MQDAMDPQIDATPGIQEAKEILWETLEKTCPEPEDVVLLAHLGNILGARGVKIKPLGHPTLKSFLLSCADLCTIVENPDEPVKVGVRPVRAEANRPSPVPATLAPSAVAANEEFPSDLLTFAFVPPSNDLHQGVLEFLLERYAIGSRYPALKDVRALRSYFSHAWKSAVLSRQVFSDGQRTIFDTGARTEFGDDILAVFEKNQIQNRQPWILRRFLRRADLHSQYGIRSDLIPEALGRSAEAVLGVTPATAGPAPTAPTRAAGSVAARADARPIPWRFSEFAHHRNFPQMLESLEALALPENWSYQTENPPRRTILQNYLIHTFQRLQKEGKVVISAEGTRAAFNTGLVDRIMLREIMACYAASTDPSPGAPPWDFLALVVEGDANYRRYIAASFPTLPKRASYYTEPRDLVMLVPMDRDPPVAIQFDHIIGERIFRFPHSYLASTLHRSTEFIDLLERKDFDALGRAVMQSPSAAVAIRRDVEKALSQAFLQLRWNYRTAIPFYYPTRNVMSFLLPLSMDDPSRPDLAIVIEHTQSGSYIAHTILELEMAYSNARLVNRVELDWLRV